MPFLLICFSTNHCSLQSAAFVQVPHLTNCHIYGDFQQIAILLQDAMSMAELCEKKKITGISCTPPVSPLNLVSTVRQ